MDRNWTGATDSCKQGQLEQVARIYGKMAGSWDRVDREGDSEGRPEDSWTSCRGAEGHSMWDISRLASVSACRHGVLVL